jgi:hypothetical protein
MMRGTTSEDLSRPLSSAVVGSFCSPECDGGGMSAAGLARKMYDACKGQTSQHAGYFLAGENVVGDETAGAPDPAAALIGNNGSMRNWYAMMPKSAVTANQSAMPPPNPAFAEACSSPRHQFR